MILRIFISVRCDIFRRYPEPIADFRVCFTSIGPKLSTTRCFQAAPLKYLIMTDTTLRVVSDATSARASSAVSWGAVRGRRSGQSGVIRSHPGPSLLAERGHLLIDITRENTYGRRTLVQLSAAAAAQSSQSSVSVEAKHAANTLEAGAVALETSRSALAKATDPNVKRFAQFEVAEQENVAMIVPIRSPREMERR